MKKYDVFGTVVASKYLGTVEAENEVEAQKKGWNLAHVSVCHQCASEIENPEIDHVYVEEV